MLVRRSCISTERAYTFRIESYDYEPSSGTVLEGTFRETTVIDFPDGHIISHRRS